MQTCWIVYNGSLTHDKFLDQALLLKEAAEKKGILAVLVKNYELLMNVHESLSTRPDFVVFLDKDILLAKYLKNEGIPVFNDPSVIEICDNKAHQYLALAKANVPMPLTIIAPKVYPEFSILNTGYYEQVLQVLQLPMIIKEAHGSFGQRVYLIETREQFFEKVEELKGIEYVFQQFIHTSRGRDIRVNVVGGQVVACMHRQSATDFRANITNGGTATEIVLTEKQKEVAIQAAAALNAEFAGVDLLFGEDEEPLVCEVNGVAHIRNIYNVTGINVGDAMISYILSKIGAVVI
ncbi:MULTISPECIES: ATP-grasp domain-containing protein [Psychrobacillus]|uniref:RimK family alpha-L-glutamate ligase n=1 Tax=Psychrobacillus faecigallinarum TaxID=2762235 RepID=A0ABR8R7N8_9BACI|nr:MULTISPECIES: RimK family alpha-L-glutamate ligase [Psychrobacillus]MBD7943724.1 RimK family alpha-L-glutamate ligase [Psychrobacillus faecigallinarum]QEY19242.1 RimK family alpha-L-glutamate ligase [Psychrobacillus sp. AK 1817]QGM29733.1 RimK family alpha-L-glutamate ligase [Bacillus sp. N3536]